MTVAGATRMGRGSRGVFMTAIGALRQTIFCCPLFLRGLYGRDCLSRCPSVAVQLFGWDNGVTGGVVSMKGFLEQFFPETIGKEATSSGDLYCTYNNQKIQWFTSSLFLAGAATEISGTTGGLCSWTCRSHLMNLKGLQTLVNVL